MTNVKCVPTKGEEQEEECSPLNRCSSLLFFYFSYFVKFYVFILLQFFI
jgi:hypothetical protein